MVTLAVRFFGQKPVECAARPHLLAAYVSLERCDFIAAGCRLREAVRLYLFAEVEYHGVEISKRKVRQTPRAMLEALHRDGICGEFCRDRINDAIEVGNRAAHCQFVRPAEIEDAIGTMHWMLDEAAYLVQPVAAGRLS